MLCLYARARIVFGGRAINVDIAWLGMIYVVVFYLFVFIVSDIENIYVVGLFYVMFEMLGEIIDIDVNRGEVILVTFDVEI